MDWSSGIGSGVNGVRCPNEKPGAHRQAVAIPAARIFFIGLPLEEAMMPAVANRRPVAGQVAQGSGDNARMTFAS
jgi:hypothetical protein